MSPTHEIERLRLRIALLGNPCVQQEWNEASVEALASFGFNAVQLNIAWLRRPFDEALNLRDVVTLPSEAEAARVVQRREELQRRCALARKFGLRTIFHFGSPYMWRNPYTGEICNNGNYIKPDIYLTDDPWFDTLNPLVVEHELSLMRVFKKQFPDVDDILVYTYDQDSWKPSEFGPSKFSRGIPLHERLPKYLQNLHHEWTDGRPSGSTMWWEPWELSAGQIYKCIPQLPREGFGLMLHNNIAEAQMTMPVDVWFRNTTRMACDLGIPVVGEGFFCSATEEIEPLSIPCPRLVDQEIVALARVPGVVGIKEYFGVLPFTFDFNVALLRERLANPTASTATLLDNITKPFGPLAVRLRRVLELLSDGLEFFPWDASWFARLAGTADIDHGWSAATVRGQMCETPSWESTRRCHFMMTDDRQPHPFLLEDVQLRLEMSVDCLMQALEILRALETDIHGGAEQAYFSRIANDVERFACVARSYALHLRETNLAMLIRQDAEAGRPPMPRLLDELGRLLEEDYENQGKQGRIERMLNFYRQDPLTFVKEYLLPAETALEKGYHTMTTR